MLACPVAFRQPDRSNIIPFFPTNSIMPRNLSAPPAPLTLLLTIVMTLVGLSPSQAQQTTDLIVRTDNVSIKAKVTRVGKTDIEYHRADNLSGPLYTISRAEVAVIVYANGTSEVMSSGTTPATQREGPIRAAPVKGQAAKSEEPRTVPASPAPVVESVAETVPKTQPLGVIDLYSVNYAGQNYSEQGISLGIVGRKKKVGLEFNFFIQTGSGSTRYGTALALTSPLKAQKAFIPFYRVGIAAGTAKFDNAKGNLLLGTVGGGVAARIGMHDKFIRFGIEYQYINTRYKVDAFPFNEVSSMSEAFAARLGFMF